MATKTGSKLSKGSDSTAPKRPRSAYMLFSLAYQPVAQSQNPDYSMCDVSKKVAAAWENLDIDEKALYEAEAGKDKARYKQEVENHKKHLDGIEEHENMRKEESQVHSDVPVGFRKVPILKDENMRKKKK